MLIYSQLFKNIEIVNGNNKKPQYNCIVVKEQLWLDYPFAPKLE